MFPNAKGILAVEENITRLENKLASLRKEISDIEEAKKSGALLCGGSSLKFMPGLKEINKFIKEKGQVTAGNITAPVNLFNEHGGFFFYSQHLAQVAMEIFGCYSKAVRVVNNGDTYTCILRYEEYDVTLSYINGNGQYYAMISCEKDSVGGVYTLENCFQREFMEFYDLLLGKPQKQNYEDFFAPVYVLNAIYRALQSGNEEIVNRYEL